MLPIVGVGMLMHFMPTKKYFTYVIVGFVLSAYLNLPIFGVALLGAGVAYVVYQNGIRRASSQATQSKSAVQGDDYDE
jgi:PTS system mannose-specific IIC component